jgi:serine protease Do
MLSFVYELNAKEINLIEESDVPSRVTPNSMDEILSFSSSIQDSIKSVVNISTTHKRAQRYMNDPYYRYFYGQPRERAQRALGSGVVLSRDGYIVTNNHVVENASSITVTLPGDTEEYSAKLIGTDKDSDLAVIKIDAPNLTPIKIADSKNLKIGDIVFAVGNPFGVGETVTQGIISALNKNRVGINQYENFIQTDASINPGNSGGALVDSRGYLIGINSAILSRSGGNNGIGFAIPSDMVKRVVRNLVEKGKVDRGYLGVSISDVTKQLRAIYNHKKGAVVVDIEEGSPADEFGLKRGDLIYEIDGKEIKNATDLKQMVAEISPKGRAVFHIERDKKDLKIPVVLSSRDEIDSIGIKGVLGDLKLSDLDRQSRELYKIPYGIWGVLIGDVGIGSKAEKLGFQSGDVIIQVENIAIRSMKSLKKALKAYKNRPKRIYVNRYGSILMFVVK